MILILDEFFDNIIKELKLLQKVLMVLADFYVIVIISRMAAGFLSIYQEKIKDILPSLKLVQTFTII